jgi:hypothetical protein
MTVIKENVKTLEPNEITDDSISKFLLVSALKQELLENDNGK